MSDSTVYNERKNEILDATENLFFSKGFQKTTIRDILEAVGIAKGTFYHYFDSKEEVLDLIVLRIVNDGVMKAKAIINNNNLSIHEKLLKIFMAQKPNTDTKRKMITQLHEVDNAQMHEKSLTETVKRLTPVLVELIKEGKTKGLFDTLYPKQTIEFLLVSSIYMFDEGLFNLSEDEVIQQIKGFIHIMEVTLGAEKGSLSYMTKVFENEIHE